MDDIKTDTKTGGNPPMDPAASYASPGSPGAQNPSPQQGSDAGAATSGEVSGGSTELDRIQGDVVAIIKTCYDPEIPVNIYELGLIYSVQVEPPGSVKVQMTLTSPACPVAGSLPPEVEAKIRSVPGVTDAVVDVVWEPPWGPSMMSEAARLQLNLD